MSGAEARGMEVIDRRGGRRGAPGGRLRGAYAAAGAGRAHGERCAEGPGFVAFDGADAGGHSGGHAGDRSAAGRETRRCWRWRFWPTAARNCGRSCGASGPSRSREGPAGDADRISSAAAASRGVTRRLAGGGRPTYWAINSPVTIPSDPGWTTSTPLTVPLPNPFTRSPRNMVGGAMLPPVPPVIWLKLRRKLQSLPMV